MTVLLMPNALGWVTTTAASAVVAVGMTISGASLPLPPMMASDSILNQESLERLGGWAIVAFAFITGLRFAMNRADRALNAFEANTAATREVCSAFRDGQDSFRSFEKDVRDSNRATLAALERLTQANERMVVKLEEPHDGR